MASAPAGLRVQSNPQQLWFQNLGSLIHNRYIKSLQPEKFGLGRKRGNRTDKNTATGNALLHLPPSGTRFQHILNQIRAE